MLLREMKGSAFAPSFKRFARCAVAGLALAGLAACGGGGGGNGSDDSEPPPCPQGQVRVDGQCRAEISIRPQQYLSFSSGIIEPSPDGPAKLAWAFGVGADASAAEEEAKTQCDRLLEDSCEAATDGETDTCAAVAISECDNNCQRGVTGIPRFGWVGTGGTLGLSRQDAETVAIRGCENSAGGDGSSCTPTVACVGTEGTTTSPAPSGVWTSSTTQQQQQQDVAACFTPPRPPSVNAATCRTNDEECSGGQKVQECPRSSSEYSTITECSVPGRGSTLTYNITPPDYRIVPLGRSVCEAEAAGARFSIVQQRELMAPCFYPSRPPVLASCRTNDGLCLGADGTRGQKVQQCPRSGSEYSAITECSVPGRGSTLTYYTPPDSPSDLDRRFCEEEPGARFSIVQQSE